MEQSNNINIHMNMILDFCQQKLIHYTDERANTKDQYWETICRSKEDILEDIIEYINSLSKNNI